MPGAHACKMGLEGIVSKRKASIYRSGRSLDWLKMKKPACAAMKREPEEDWGQIEWRFASSKPAAAAVIVILEWL
jgi:hypothetical protein